jgi:hypothetical protein
MYHTAVQLALTLFFVVIMPGGAIPWFPLFLALYVLAGYLP